MVKGSEGSDETQVERADSTMQQNQTLEIYGETPQHRGSCKTFDIDKTLDPILSANDNTSMSPSSVVRFRRNVEKAW
ncbi:hypothetical protein E6O75_ATG01563 [Venturia nashicola]|uniref:Uncharacterized protein n=1 Tax=Venturia nashicola TaxID=86259 RepID=A0A4Z1PE65_9PEZI|nr:hypothetical protein E6O75_ATG01563 [Venturia nashicola]